MSELLKQYERLLLQRDTLRKEADSNEARYLHEFGEELTAAFEVKVACIRTKKTLAFCQASVNRGEAIDLNALTRSVEAAMSPYYAQLEGLRHAEEACRELKYTDTLTVTRVKKLYRTLAKSLHPDLHPELAENEAVRELWSRIVESYDENDLEALEEFSVTASTLLSELGCESDLPEPENLEERIASVQEEIDTITSTDPWLYGELLDDPEATGEKHHALQEELKSWQDYLNLLNERLKELLKGGNPLTWQTN